LGIDIYASLDTIVAKNYKKMYTTIKDDLKKWINITISLAGRISIIKMNILPRVNFLASTVCYLYLHQTVFETNFRIGFQNIFGKTNTQESDTVQSSTI